MDAINHVKIHPFPSPSFRTALSKPRNLSYFPLKIRSRPKKGENRPRLRTERFGSWVSKIARLIEDTTQKTSTNFSPQRHQNSRVTTLQKHRHPGWRTPPKWSLKKKYRKAPKHASVVFFGSLRSYNNLPCLKRVQSRHRTGGLKSGYF